MRVARRVAGGPAHTHQSARTNNKGRLEKIMRTIVSQRIAKLSGVSAAVLIALACSSVNAESERGNSFAQRQCEERTSAASADTAYGDEQCPLTLEESLQPAAGKTSDGNGGGGNGNGGGKDGGGGDGGNGGGDGGNGGGDGGNGGGDGGNGGGDGGDGGDGDHDNGHGNESGGGDDSSNPGNHDGQNDGNSGGHGSNGGNGDHGGNGGNGGKGKN